ncbi:MAG: Tad domain-containing protein [Chloroflexota bacterium]|nr:hypothetical protein [Chloroflexota bacterium]MDE3101125.1 Tad domain-containing protein [Chloroflexota bacterium]
MNHPKGILSRTEGQSLVIVALSMIVLIGALAFAIDWGYGLTQRRAMSNSAEAGALGAGVLLARSVVPTTDGFVFSRSQEETYCAAEAAAALDRDFAPAGAEYSLTVEGFADRATQPAWSLSGIACPAASRTTLPIETRTLRVVATVSYRSLIASVVGWPQMTAAGSIRARIVGVPYDASGRNVWPMVRHYDASDLVQKCDDPCDPLGAEPFTFWSPQGTEPNMVYGNFKGQVDLSKRSSREPDPTIDQLIHQWDESGSPEAGTQPKPDLSGNCKGSWDTIGGDDESVDKQCSIPNWFYYFFGGELSLDEAPTGHPGAEPPSPIGPRPTICADVPGWIEAPSCAPGKAGVGDWVETATGNVGVNNSELMVEAIRRAYAEGYGFTTPYSDLPVPGKQNMAFGKALVVTIFMWDCAETYSSNAPQGERWSLIDGGTLPDGTNDCSQIPPTGSTPMPDRVHLFTVVPFTFYEGLIETSSIRGYWGGAVGSADGCPTGDCSLDPLTNTVILRPDE